MTERLTDATAAFWAMVRTGKALMERHVHYEQAQPYPLEYHWAPGVERTYHVNTMKLSKDRTRLVVNESLMLSGIPPECFEYHLGNRPALEWVIDQYCVGQDEVSGHASDPNREDDPQYIVRLVRQVVTVSIETVHLVNDLAARVNFDDFELVGAQMEEEESMREYWRRE